LCPPLLVKSAGIADLILLTQKIESSISGLKSNGTILYVNCSSYES
jgi:hypothetical protein